MSKDISRYLLQPRKRYSSVRMQQGRVILDSDWNESERIDDEQARRTLVDLICSKGTSNRGFRVRNVVGNVPVTPRGADSVATYDFEFENGSFYIGGLRFETETDPDEGPETFLKQSDWLQIDALAANLPTLPVDLPAGRPRHDLVYLRGWEQCVTAVEDSELRERALGGSDTSVRIRNMRRVEVLTDVPDTCAVAFNRLVEQLTKPILPDTGEPHEFDRQNSELKSKARLKVTPDPEAITEDPCKPAVPGGYLGADNQTIRVQLTATDRFIWSYDNAAPIYRVRVDNIPDVPAGVDGARRKIKFLTLPRDQAAQPLAGQAVEIIPWGALLPNMEKVAEFQGAFFTVETSFDPEDNSLTITEPVFEEWVEWLADHPQFWSDRDEPEDQQYFYLRLWTGGSGEPIDPDHKFTPGSPVALKGTGLSVTFSDHGLAGDFWIIAARPNTPELVVPWELLDEAPPAGPRYFFAPLALIRWTLDQNQLQASVHDCRERFRPLCDLGGCCTVTVGDGVSSRGDFDSVEDALDHLPDAGGEVCLLAGQHRVNAVLIGRRNITIKGCGRQTRVIPRESNRAGAIFRVVDSQGITLRDMDIVTLEGTAIVLEGSKPDALKEVEISHTRIIAFKQAIQTLGGTGIHIHDNCIRMLDREGAGNAIQILAEGSVIERNDIGVVPAERTPPPDQPDDDDTPDPTEPCADPEIIYVRPGFLTVLIAHIFQSLIVFLPAAPFRARGGIQILAASERIKVLDNVITGGADNGITLGGLPGSPEVDPAPPPPVIETREELIRGKVLRLSDNAPQPGIDLVFTRSDGKEFKTTSKPNGDFEVFNTVPAKHEVAVTTPGVRIEKIEFEDRGSSRFHTVMVVIEDRPQPEPALPFIYDIQIDRNEISQMGLSGIGYPIISTIILGRAPGLTIHNPAIANILALLGNPVLTLGIHRNHIHDCLQNPFEGELRAEARRRGFGGISLGFCENVTISANRIEKNGRSHINPAVGIFMRLGAKVDIYHNHIFDNGPFTPSEIPPDLEFGIRGGIVLLVASIGIIEAFPESRKSPDMKMHAARIHDNIVHQPVGHALRLLGLGATSICDNRFISDMSGPEDLEKQVGLVYVLTTGGIGTFFASPTLFNSNQSHLGERAASLMSQSIITTDDIGFDGNQSVAMTDGLVLSDTVSMFANTFLVGQTLRATDNRFKEPPGIRRGAIKFSLVTRTSLLNNTNDNQGNHCILPFNTATNPARPPNDAGNQVVDDRLCPRLNNSIKAPVTVFPVTATRDV